MLKGLKGKDRLRVRAFTKAQDLHRSLVTSKERTGREKLPKGAEKDGSCPIKGRAPALRYKEAAEQIMSRCPSDR